MSSTAVIATEDRAKALAALYNASQPQGIGFMVATPNPMSDVEAAKMLERTCYVDYLQGRVIKTDFKASPEVEFLTLDLRLYDRDNGEGAGVQALQNGGVPVHG